MFHVNNKRVRIHSSHLSDMNPEMVTDPQFPHSFKKYLSRVPQDREQDKQDPSPGGHVSIPQGQAAHSPVQSKG